MKRTRRFFENNCNLWAKTNPQKAILLPYVDVSLLSPCLTAFNEANLAFEWDGKTEYFYPQSGAIEEANVWFESLHLEETTILFVYGIGLGYYYLAAKKWLQEDSQRKLVFLEDNLAIISCFFETSLATEILKNDQVQLHYFQNIEENKELFNQLYWNFFLTPLDVSALKLYERLKVSQTEELKHKILYDASLKNGLLIEYLEYGVGFYKNFYPNILCLEGSYLADDLFGKFKNVPAIICGAGPSLERNLSQLGNLTDKALIFAGGSALNALNNSNIQPHFGAGIDPNAPQYDRLSTNTAFEVPFFYRNRLFHEAFKTIHGQKLYVRGTGGYEVSKFFEERLNIQGEVIEEGHNVVNFCLEIAHALGCNPIIFIGMDLAYTDMKAYASGVVQDNTVDKKEITSKDSVDQAALIKKDIHGKPIYTLWKWIAESEWIGNFAKEHSEITVINATEGGLGFPSVPNMTLKEAVKNLHKAYDFKGRIHAHILNASLPNITSDKILVLIQELLDSLQRCIEDFDVLIEESEIMKNRIKKEKKVPFPQQTGRASLFESELGEEIGYQYVLHLFNEAYTRVLNRELQLLNNGKRISEVKQTLGKIDILIKRFVFLRDVAKVNIELIKLGLNNYVLNPSFTFKRPGIVFHKESEGDSLYFAGKQLVSKVNTNEAKLYYPDGKLYSEQFFKDGKWHGQQRYYYPNGNIKTLLEYQEGVLIKAELFNVDGSLKHSRTFL